MKKVINVFIFATALFVSGGANAQHIINLTGKENLHAPQQVEQTIKVSGECETCRIRIEQAALSLEGVKKAHWDEGKQEIALIYIPSQVTKEAIEQKIASVGHDTEDVKADDKVFNTLPKCCQYTRKGN